jgi:hypothetical protein
MRQSLVDLPSCQVAREYVRDTRTLANSHLSQIRDRKRQFILGGTDPMLNQLSLAQVARRVMKWKMDVGAMKMQEKDDDVIVDSVTCCRGDI